MTWVDLAVLGVLALSGLLAFMRGLVREVLGIGAWVGAIMIATAGLPHARPLAGQWIHDPQIVTAVCFAALLLIALIVLSLIARAISKLIKGSALGGIDRTLGLLFGLLRGAAVIIIAYIIAGMAVAIDHWPPAVLEARSLSLTYEGAKWVRQNLLPPEYQPRLYEPPTGRQASADALLRAAPLGRATGR
jgi:membrane protein required for colicin V production